MPYTDAYGTWREITPVFVEVTDEWVTLPNSMSVASSLIRIKYETDWVKWSVPNGYRSYGWLRDSYQDDSQQFGNLVGLSRKIYPKQQEVVFSYPPLPELKDNPYSVRKLQIKKQRQYRPYPRYWVIEHQTSEHSPPPDLVWRIYMEYLLE